MAVVHLIVASVHLQRNSLRRTESCGGLALQLEREENANRQLHRLIIEAKTNGANGWIGR